MHTPRRHIGQELGTALAVLAIYLLTLLTPLHQARASQLEFSALGYAALDSGWVWCAAALPGGDAGKQSIAKCPVSGAGKTSLAEPLAPNLALPLQLVRRAAVPPARRHGFAPAVLDPGSPPRAPPPAI